MIKPVNIIDREMLLKLQTEPGKIFALPIGYDLICIPADPNYASFAPYGLATGPKETAYIYYHS